MLCDAEGCVLLSHAGQEVSMQASYAPSARELAEAPANGLAQLLPPYSPVAQALPGINPLIMLVEAEQRAGTAHDT